MFQSNWRRSARWTLLGWSVLTRALPLSKRTPSKSRARKNVLSFSHKYMHHYSFSLHSSTYDKLKLKCYIYLNILPIRLLCNRLLLQPTWGNIWLICIWNDISLGGMIRPDLSVKINVCNRHYANKSGKTCSIILVIRVHCIISTISWACVKDQYQIVKIPDVREKAGVFCPTLGIRHKPLQRQVKCSPEQTWEHIVQHKIGTFNSNAT